MIKRLHRLCGALALLLLGAAAVAHAQGASEEPAAPQISLLTFGPGEVYWQRFGHNALLVRSADGLDAEVYNYGIFDFHQQNFFLNFARGHMLYRLDRAPLLPTLRQYAAEGRWVVEQRLALDAAQRRALAELLQTNALPQNAEYRYDYFLANCSTRVRDALDQVLGGQLRSPLQQQPTPISYRAEVLQLMAAEPALKLGMDFGLGSLVDAPLNAWQDGFIPMRLMLALRAVRIDTGSAGERALIEAEHELVRVPGQAPPTAAPQPLPAPAAWPFLLAGLAWATLLIGSAWCWPRALFAPLASLQVMLGGLLGLVLLLGWLATDHWGMARNLNLLMVNPLWWGLLPAALRRFCRRPRPAATALWGLGLIALAAVPGLYFSTQENLHWLAALLPAQLTLLGLLLRPGRAV